MREAALEEFARQWWRLTALKETTKKNTTGGVITPAKDRDSTCLSSIFAARYDSLTGARGRPENKLAERGSFAVLLTRCAEKNRTPICC